MNRPVVSVFIATSIDGYIADEDGGIGFLDVVQAPGQDYGYRAFYDSVDTLVLGRTTWETVQAFPEWPFAGKRVVVLTHRPLAARHGEQTHAGELTPLLTRLHAEGVRRVYLDGGSAIRQALAEGVVDDMTLSTIPVLLGRGRPLFGERMPASCWPGSLWKLADLQPYPGGLVQCTWQRVSGHHLP